MRTFPVQMPSGMRYWTVIGEDLLVMSVADAYLRYLRFRRDAAESTTKTYAGAFALYLSWCAATGWRAATAEDAGVRVVAPPLSVAAGGQRPAVRLCLRSADRGGSTACSQAYGASCPSRNGHPPRRKLEAGHARNCSNRLSPVSC